MSDDWKTAGATGDTAPTWLAFTDAALELLDGHEDPYALVSHLVAVTERWYALQDAAAEREP